jgi:hypothetical protein
MNAKPVARFLGLNNTQEPRSLGLSWLVQADNVVVTDAGKLELRQGYSRTMAGTFTGAYATKDRSRFYVVDGGAMKAMVAGGASGVTLASGLDTDPMAFTEVNGQVFYTNGVDSGIVTPDNRVLPWAWDIPAAPTLAAVTGALDPGLYRVCCTQTLADGRETGASDIVELEIAAGEALQISSIPQTAGLTTNVYIAPANSTVFQRASSPTVGSIVWNASPDALNTELLTADLEPLPDGCTVVQEWGGAIYAAQHFPEHDYSAIWKSQPLGFHLFDLERNAILVPGQVRMLAPHAAGLVIGTDREVKAWDGAKLADLAPYGVVPGQHWSEDDDKTVIFWSQRGACRALPFSNLTEQQASVAPGLRAGGAIVRQGGQRRYIVSLQTGGTAFNAH